MESHCVTPCSSGGHTSVPQCVVPGQSSVSLGTQFGSFGTARQARFAPKRSQSLFVRQKKPGVSLGVTFSLQPAPVSLAPSALDGAGVLLHPALPGLCDGPRNTGVVPC